MPARHSGACSKHPKIQVIWFARAIGYAFMCMCSFRCRSQYRLGESALLSFSAPWPATRGMLMWGNSDSVQQRMLQVCVGACCKATHSVYTGNRLQRHHMMLAFPMLVASVFWVYPFLHTLHPCTGYTSYTGYTSRREAQNLGIRNTSVKVAVPFAAPPLYSPVCLHVCRPRSWTPAPWRCHWMCRHAGGDVVCCWR